jgi:hypothetical protein
MNCVYIDAKVSGDDRANLFIGVGIIETIEHDELNGEVAVDQHTNDIY